MCILQGIQQQMQLSGNQKQTLRFNISIENKNINEEIELDWSHIQLMESIDQILQKLNEWQSLQNQQITVELQDKNGQWQKIDRKDDGFRIWLGYENNIRIQIDQSDYISRDYGIFEPVFEMNDDLFYLDNMRQEQFDFLVQNQHQQSSTNDDDVMEDLTSMLKLEEGDYMKENQLNQEVDGQQQEQQEHYQFLEVKIEQEYVSPINAHSEDQIFFETESKRDSNDDAKSLPKITRKRIEKFGRNGEKTVDEASQLVNNYLRISRENRKITKDKAAKQLGQKKKTLDDYKLQLKIAKFLGFDFESHKNDGMGKVRMFNEAQIKSSNINRKQMIFNLQSVDDEEF